MDLQIAPGSRWTHLPFTMVASFLVALALCIGHDQFHRWLDGQHISTAISQIWASRIATGLAFLIQTLLVFAASIAYQQRQWFVLRSKTFRIGQIDHLTGVLGDLTALFDLRLWWKTPISFLVAIIAWLLPLTVVITPSTLVVTSDCQSEGRQSKVPQLSYNSTEYAVFGALDAGTPYEQQSPEVSRITYASATSSQILAIPHDYQNMTYTAQFYGPAVKCQTANQTVIDAVNEYLIGYIGSGGAYYYFSWVPGDDHGVFGNHSKTESSGNPSEGTYTTFDVQSTDVARLFLVEGYQNNCTDRLCHYPNVTECRLHNATYKVYFTFTNLDQQIDVHSLQFHEEIAGLQEYGSGGQYAYPVLREDLTSNVSTHESYQAVMQSFGSLLVGNTYNRRVTQSSYHLLNVDWNNLNNTQRDLEQLFQNITISLMSSSILTLNSTQAALVPIDRTTCPQVYTYHPKVLYISYGAGLLATFLSVLLGLHALYLNGGKSYSNKFSTFLRTTRDVSLKSPLPNHTGSVYMDGDDGANPLPKPVKKTRIQLSAGLVTSDRGSWVERGFARLRSRGIGERRGSIGIGMNRNYVHIPLDELRGGNNAGQKIMDWGVRFPASN